MKSDFIKHCASWMLNNGTELWHRALIAFVVLAVANFILWGTAKFLQNRLQKRHSVWLQAWCFSIRMPGTFFIWIAGISYTLFVVTHSPLNTAGMRFIGLVFIISLIWMVLRALKFAEKRYQDVDYSKSKQQRETVATIARLARVVTVIIGGIVILQTLGISVAGLIAFGGIGAAGIAFSAKDILGNFFGGLMIFFNRPFGAGDWIRSPDRNVEGTVEHIGWLLTRIRTFDKRPLYVPNGIFSNIAIENPQRMLNRRIKQNIGIRYDDAGKIAQITTDIKAMLNAHEEIDTNQTIIVDLVTFGASSLDVMLYCFTKTTDWVKFQDIQQDVFLKIIAIVEGLGVQCAFPTTTLHVKGDVPLVNK